MAAAEALKITRDIDDKVKDVDDKGESVDVKVVSVIEGVLCLLNWPESS